MFKSGYRGRILAANDPHHWTSNRLNGGWKWPAFGIVVLLVAPWMRGARAEDWYPKECRSGASCARVVRASYAHAAIMGEELLTVTTRHGTALVPTDLLRRESMDGRMHACMRPDQEGMQLICMPIPLDQAAAN